MEHDFLGGGREVGVGEVGEHERMWRAFLQRMQDHVAHAILFAAQLPIPKSQHLDSCASQVRITRLLARALFGEPMLSAIEFDVQSRLQAKEI